MCTRVVVMRTVDCTAVDTLVGVAGVSAREYVGVHCTDWPSEDPSITGGDASRFGGDGGGGSGGGSILNIPGGVNRGGGWAEAERAGVFAVNSVLLPSESYDYYGFRCAR